MTLHEESSRAEMVRSQIELLNATLEMDVPPDDKHAIAQEILRLSRLIT